MITSQQIAKEIDLKRFLSIVEDLPKIELKEPYNFDFPITFCGYAMVGKNKKPTFKFSQVTTNTN